MYTDYTHRTAVLLFDEGRHSFNDMMEGKTGVSPSLDDDEESESELSSISSSSTEQDHRH